MSAFMMARKVFSQGAFCSAGTDEIYVGLTNIATTHREFLHSSAEKVLVFLPFRVHATTLREPYIVCALVLLNMVSFEITIRHEDSLKNIATAGSSDMHLLVEIQTYRSGSVFQNCSARGDRIGKSV